MGLIWQSFRNWKRKHWFCHLQSFNGQPKLWFSDPKVVQLWAGKLELRLSSKIGWVGDSNGWDKLTHIPKPKQYDVKEGVLSSERMKNEQTVTHIFHTSNIYQLVWLVTTTTQSWAEKVPIHCWWNYLTIRIHIPVFVWQAPQFLLVKPSNLVENTKTSPAEARQNPPGKKNTFCLIHMCFWKINPGGNMWTSSWNIIHLLETPGKRCPHVSTSFSESKPGPCGESPVGPPTCPSAPKDPSPIKKEFQNGSRKNQRITYY